MNSLREYRVVIGVVVAARLLPSLNPWYRLRLRHIAPPTCLWRQA